MKIQLNINRIKQNNQIKEVFNYTNNSFTKDSHRQIYQCLQYLISQHSLADQLHLQEIQELNNGKIFIYNFENIKIQEFYKQITINYFPVLGQRKCSNCYHKINHTSLICNLKGKQKKIQTSCLSWKEKSLDNLIRGTNVYKQGRSGAISRPNTHLLKYNGRRTGTTKKLTYE